MCTYVWRNMVMRLLNRVNLLNIDLDEVTYG
jgi:hypothetical protein